MRTGVKGYWRTSKRNWYESGGFRNSLCWRRQVRGAWQYFINLN